MRFVAPTLVTVTRRCRHGRGMLCSKASPEYFEQPAIPCSHTFVPGAPIAEATDHECALSPLGIQAAKLAGCPSHTSQRYWHSARESDFISFADKFCQCGDESFYGKIRRAGYAGVKYSTLSWFPRRRRWNSTHSIATTWIGSVRGIFGPRSILSPISVS